jgi:hypothetical protein
MPTALSRTMACELARRPVRRAEDCRAQFTQRADDLPVRLEETK